MQLRTFARRQFARQAAAGFVAVVVGVRPPDADATDGFLSRLEDLPLPPGLAEDTRSGISFDTAGGRIVEAFARGEVTERQVLDFYRETLPQLGWTPESSTEYRRGGERLRIALTTDAHGLVVHYSLSPQ